MCKYANQYVGVMMINRYEVSGEIFDHPACAHEQIDRLFGRSRKCANLASGCVISAMLINFRCYYPMPVQIDLKIQRDIIHDG